MGIEVKPKPIQFNSQSDCLPVRCSSLHSTHHILGMGTNDVQNNGTNI